MVFGMAFLIILLKYKYLGHVAQWYSTGPWV